VPYASAALETRRRLLGDDHPDTLSSMSLLGSLLEIQGKPNEAEPLLSDSLERRRRVLGRDHPDTLQSLNMLGSLWHGQGKLNKAEGLRSCTRRSRGADVCSATTIRRR
jgi:hypothetical protein